MRRGPVARRCARAAVLIALTITIASQLALGVVADTIRPQWRDPEFFHRQRGYTRLVKAADRPRPVVVVLGSSRSEMGFSPEHCMAACGPDYPLVYNLSQSGCQPVGQRMNLGRLLDRGPKPDAVLVEILPSALTVHSPLDEQIPVSRLSHADLRRVAPYYTDPDAVRRRWLTARTRSWHELRFDLLAHAGLADWNAARVRTEFLWTNMSGGGWSSYYPANWTTANSVARFEAVRPAFTTQLADFRVNPRVAQAHHDLLAECRAHGIRAAVYLTPESPAFRELYPPEVRQQLREYVSGLGVPVFDATDWIDDEGAFMDGYHLLGPGAEAFSQRFGGECVGPWISGPGGSAANLPP